MPYAAGLALAVTLAGCAAESAAPEPAGTVPSPPPASRSVTISEATSSTLAPRTSAAPDFPDGVPEAARKRTKEGAEAFVRHFVDVVNASWKKPNPEAIRALCQRESESCSGYASLAEELRTKRHRASGDSVAVRHQLSLSTIEGVHRVHTTIEVLGSSIVTSTGKVVDTDEETVHKNIFSLIWTRQGWSIKEVDVA